MARKKDKKKEAKRAKLPKRIAGVKVPKQLRAPGGKLVEAMKNPLVAEVAAAAFVAAAAAMRESPAARPASGGASGKTGQAANGAALLGNLLAAKALEGVRKLAEASGGSGGNGAGRRRSSGEGDV